MRTKTLSRISAAFALVLLALATGCAGEADSSSKPSSSTASSATPAKIASEATTTPSAGRIQTAIFAGGCFWCVETQFEGVPGVKTVVSGFTGGTVKNPTYNQVTAGGTGHYESVEVRFDPSVVTYSALVDMFWHSIDPTQGDGQFCDRGESYRSAIFWNDETQRKEAEASKARIEKSGVLKAPIKTKILPAAVFYPAEEYHQDFWKKDPERYHSYREGCGRDARVERVWGKLAAKPSVH